MYKPHCKIASLPSAVREEINSRLHEGWQFDTIRKWLFEQKTDRDIPDLKLKPGDPYSLIWTRDSKSESMGQATCRSALSRWFHSHYRRWLDDQSRREESLLLIERVEKLSRDASQKGQPGSSAGGNLLLRSLLIDTIEKIRKGCKNPTDLARLAHAWARLNESGHRVQSSIDTGLGTLRDEIKTNPEALELFRKLRDVLKRTP